MKNINKTTDEYKNMVKENQPAKTKGINILKAYVVGGLICVVGQGLWDIYMVFGFNQEDAGTMGTLTLILLGGLLTGIGVYDEMGQFAGAGTLVPVTGFANAMVSPALEYKQDGFILGMSAKLFSVAGPVLTYGIVSAFIIGVLKELLGG